MKTIRARTWAAMGVSVLTAATMLPASADESATAASKMDSYTGTIVSANPQEQVMSVKGWTMLNKEFNLGQNCAFSQLGKDNATANDLRIGEKVTVSYQDAHGVLIASRIQQEPMQFEGTVKTIDNEKHLLVLHRTALDKELQLPADCKIMLHDGKAGTLADIQTGSHVTVTYEMPANMPTVRQIAQASIPFTGTLTAIDLDKRTLKAKGTVATKKFNLADNCLIVINGRPDGKLGDLKPNDKLVMSYDEINGVNVVNRIMPVENRSDSVATYGPSTTPPMTGY